MGRERKEEGEGGGGGEEEFHHNYLLKEKLTKLTSFCNKMPDFSMFKKYNFK